MKYQFLKFNYISKLKLYNSKSISFISGISLSIPQYKKTNTLLPAIKKNFCFNNNKYNDIGNNDADNSKNEDNSNDKSYKINSLFSNNSENKRQTSEANNTNNRTIDIYSKYIVFKNIEKLKGPFQLFLFKYSNNSNDKINITAKIKILDLLVYFDSNSSKLELSQITYIISAFNEAKVFIKECRYMISHFINSYEFECKNLIEKMEKEEEILKQNNTASSNATITTDTNTNNNNNNNIEATKNKMLGILKESVILNIKLLYFLECLILIEKDKLHIGLTQFILNTIASRLDFIYTYSINSSLYNEINIYNREKFILNIPKETEYYCFDTETKTQKKLDFEKGNIRDLFYDILELACYFEKINVFTDRYLYNKKTNNFYIEIEKFLPKTELSTNFHHLTKACVFFEDVHNKSSFVNNSLMNNFILNMNFEATSRMFMNNSDSNTNAYSNSNFAYTSPQERLVLSKINKTLNKDYLRMIIILIEQNVLRSLINNQSLYNHENYMCITHIFNLVIKTILENQTNNKENIEVMQAHLSNNNFNQSQQLLDQRIKLYIRVFKYINLIFLLNLHNKDFFYNIESIFNNFSNIYSRYIESFISSINTTQVDRKTFKRDGIKTLVENLYLNSHIASIMNSKNYHLSDEVRIESKSKFNFVYQLKSVNHSLINFAAVVHSIRGNTKSKFQKYFEDLIENGIVTDSLGKKLDVEYEVFRYNISIDIYIKNFNLCIMMNSPFHYYKNSCCFRATELRRYETLVNYGYNVEIINYNLDYLFKFQREGFNKVLFDIVDRYNKKYDESCTSIYSRAEAHNKLNSAANENTNNSYHNSLKFDYNYDVEKDRHVIFNGFVNKDLSKKDMNLIVQNTKEYYSYVNKFKKEYTYLINE